MKFFRQVAHFQAGTLLKAFERQAKKTSIGPTGMRTFVIPVNTVPKLWQRGRSGERPLHGCRVKV